jgi:hypothetical protein
MKKNRLALILRLALFVIPILTGCVKLPDKVPDEVRNNADLITENILISMNDEDYGSFSQDFNGGMKTIYLPQECFADFLASTKGIYGPYVEDSKQYDGFTAAVLLTGEIESWEIKYKTQFTKREGIYVTVALRDNKVLGLTIGNVNPLLTPCTK